MDSLKDYARAYTVDSGALKGVTLWMLGFRTVAVEQVITDLNRITPEVSYVHKDGRRVDREPSDLKAERKRVEEARQVLLDRAEKLKTDPDPKKLAALVVVSDWERVYNWNVQHQAFWCYEPLLVDVDFPEMDDQTPAELGAFARYWRGRPDDTAARWAVFSRVLGTETANALYFAYQATRDKSFQPTDGAEESGGSEDTAPLAVGELSIESS